MMPGLTVMPVLLVCGIQVSPSPSMRRHSARAVDFYWQVLFGKWGCGVNWVERSGVGLGVERKSRRRTICALDLSIHV